MKKEEIEKIRKQVREESEGNKILISKFQEHHPKPKTLYFLGDEDGDVKILWDLNDDVSPPTETILNRYDCINLQDFDGTGQCIYVNTDIMNDLKPNWYQEHPFNENDFVLELSDTKLVCNWGFPFKNHQSEINMSTFKNQVDDFPTLLKIGKQEYYKIY